MMGFAGFSFAVLLVAVAAGCGKTDAKPPESPPKQATVTAPVKEGELTTVKLTPAAEKRLLVAEGLAEARRKKVRRTVSFAGEVMLIPGRSAIVTAPVTGTVAVVGDPLPRPGSPVSKDKPLLTIAPLIPAERLLISPAERLTLAVAQASLRLRVVELKAGLAATLADAEGGVARAQVAHDAAVIAHKRAEQLVRDKAAGTRVLDEAVAVTDSAKAGLEAAIARRKVILDTKLEIPDAPEVAPAQPAVLSVAAPIDGVMRDVRVQPGQQVSAGAVLFDVMDAAVVWVRVAVPVTELDHAPVDGDAAVRTLNAGARDPSVPVKPAAAPPTADPLAETADLHYELPNSEGRFRPGQRVVVTLSQREEEDVLTVPWGAVLYDIHGGAWVYEQTAPQTFVRRRVQVARVDGATAVLGDPAGALKAGAKVVTSGAAELFGVEFGVGK